MESFPRDSVLRWRRLDAPGRETARTERTAAGRRLTGKAEVQATGADASLYYRLECTADWRTRRALVSGVVSGAEVRMSFTADGQGAWQLGGAPLPLAEGALDIDLGFTPATNLLPIRRLNLPVGARAEVRAVWLRFPELRVEMLQQSYRREAAQVFRYEALVDGAWFHAHLDTDAFGRVLRYEGLWEAAGVETAGPPASLGG